MLRPPTTNDPALNLFLEEVASTIQDRVRPEEGWSLSDFASSVSEVISDKRDLIDIVTQYDNIEGLSEEMEVEIARLESEIQSSMDLLSSVNSKSAQFAEVMAWWDQNYTIIFDAQEALSIFQEIQGAMMEHQDLLSQTTAAKAAAEQAAAEAASAEEAANAAAAAAQASETSATDAAARASASETSATDAAARASASETEVGEAREYVSGVHESWLPGGSARKTLDRLVSNTMEARSQALDARDDAQGHADRAEAAAAGVDQVVSDVTGVLAGKADTGHSHTIADVTGLHDALGGKAAVSHQHSWGDVTGKPTVYPPESHAHPSTQITDSTATGRAVLTASSAAAARQAIGAGTSNLALGTTSSTAAAGNHTHTQYATTAQVEARTPEIRTVSQLPASPSPGVVYIVMGA